MQGPGVEKQHHREYILKRSNVSKLDDGGKCWELHSVRARLHLTWEEQRKLALLHARWGHISAQEAGLRQTPPDHIE